MVKCKNCGHTNTNENNFCEHCGKKLKNNITMVKCKNCGHTNTNENNFCEHCGKKLKLKNKPSQSDKPIPEQNINYGTIVSEDELLKKERQKTDKELETIKKAEERERRKQKRQQTQEEKERKKQEKNNLPQDKESLKSHLNLVVYDEKIINKIEPLIENGSIKTYNELKIKIKELQQLKGKENHQEKIIKKERKKRQLHKYDSHNKSYSNDEYSSENLKKINEKNRIINAKLSKEKIIKEPENRQLHKYDSHNKSYSNDEYSSENLKKINEKNRIINAKLTEERIKRVKKNREEREKGPSKQIKTKYKTKKETKTIPKTQETKEKVEKELKINNKNEIKPASNGICPYCGRKLNPVAFNCGHCGHRIKQVKNTKIQPQNRLLTKLERSKLDPITKVAIKNKINNLEITTISELNQEIKQKQEKKKKNSENNKNTNKNKYASKNKFCPQCGRKIKNSTDKFCENCGYDLINEKTRKQSPKSEKTDKKGSWDKVKDGLKCCCLGIIIIFALMVIITYISGG